MGRYTGTGNDLGLEMDEINGNNNNNSHRVRGSIEMNDETIRRITSTRPRKNSQGSGKEMQYHDLDAILSNQQQNPSENYLLQGPYDDDQDEKTDEDVNSPSTNKQQQIIDSDEIDENKNENKNNLPQGPTSWQEVLQNMVNKKKKQSTMNESVQSNYEDSETNMEEKIDAIEEEIREIKDLVTQILNDTNEISPNINNNLNPIKRQINRMFVMLTGSNVRKLIQSDTEIVTSDTESDSDLSSTNTNPNIEKKKKKFIKIKTNKIIQILHGGDGSLAT